MHKALGGVAEGLVRRRRSDPRADQNRPSRWDSQGCFTAQPSQSATGPGSDFCGVAKTLCDDGMIAAGQWIVTGTRTQTSVGTCLQTVLGTHTFLHSVTLRVTCTGTHVVRVTGT